MKLTAQVQLKPSAEQASSLLRTLEEANSAANRLSDLAWEQRAFRRFDLHRLAYHQVRAETGLTAQMVIRLIAKVSDAYKLDKATKRVFRLHGAIAYDDRILRWYGDHVSIWSVAGRLKIPFVCGERQRALLNGLKGESDLLYRDGKWYLLTVCDVIDPPEGEPTDMLGVDLGIVSLATDSDGVSYSGSGVETNRRIYAHRRRNLQRTGTKSAKRKLKRLSGRQRRYQYDVNHCISKRIVGTAEGTHRGIALEDLTHIRERLTVRRRQRARFANWSFCQLRSYLSYKAKLSGVPVVLVDPRNSSRTCSRCGHCDKANRKSQAQFLCVSCGFSLNADYNAALNLRARAVVMLPNGSNPKVSGLAPGTSRLL